MSPTVVSGTEGYAEEAGVLIPRYSAMDFDTLHAPVRQFFPDPPARVLDIGAGTGRDAAVLAELGYTVTAAEPVTPFREAAMAQHASAGVTWLNDSLPNLDVVSAREERFDLILMTAVWMHLDEGQRCHGMPVIAGLLAPGGLVILSLRHGPFPEGRRMFDVTVDETIALAVAAGLTTRYVETNQECLRRRPDVRWDRAVFQRPG